MYVGCAQKYCGAIYKTELYSGANVVFNILIFFSETTSRWRLIYDLMGQNQSHVATSSYGVKCTRF